MKRLTWKRILAIIAGVIVVLIAAAATYIFWPQSVDLSHLANSGEGYNVRILRDTWGVPHIFGQTDADTAYGLAYAHSEDDFLTIQQTLVAARGQLASVYGAGAAPNDYMVQLLRIWDVVEEKSAIDLLPETHAILKAYADGLNHYAALHPDEVLTQELFPVSEKDMVAASVHKSPLFFGLDNTLGELFAEMRQSEVSSKENGFQISFDAHYGSNTFSVAPGRTPDGSTYLAVNSHQPWQGAVTWYEAHLHSEEGWDAVGGTFPGTPAIAHGHNRHLGWAFTVNNPDLADVYVLEINPENEYQYKFDGEWLDLEVREAPIKVKLLGNFSWTVKEEVLWSVYGPVVRQDHGTYALRYAGYGLVNIFEQLYLMNKAADFETWQDAMRNGGLASFNTGYADAEGNIYYLYNAMIPLREEGYDWSLYLPGDTSETLWTGYLPFDDLPQVFNPPSGFVQNANSSPFKTTSDPWNPDPDDYSPTLGIETSMTNRAWRALAQLEADESITFEEFKDYKYDKTYAPESDIAMMVGMILESPLPDDADIQTAIDILRGWDFQTGYDSTAATLAIWTLYYLYESDSGINPGALGKGEIPPAVLVDCFTQAVMALKDKHGSVAVPWSQTNRLVRGDVDLGLAGAPDVLHAIYGEMQDDGRFVGFQGDSYVMLVRWDSEGEVQSQSIHQYGSATLDETSPHYADQAPVFAQQGLKPVWFDEADIRANLEREYRPGEETNP
jgi:acyl-homoserine-lactone acylase